MIKILHINNIIGEDKIYTDLVVSDEDFLKVSKCGDINQYFVLYKAIGKIYLISESKMNASKYKALLNLTIR